MGLESMDMEYNDPPGSFPGCKVGWQGLVVQADERGRVAVAHPERSARHTGFPKATRQAQPVRMSGRIPAAKMRDPTAQLDSFQTNSVPAGAKRMQLSLTTAEFEKTPVCLDQPWLAWADARLNKQDVNISRVGRSSWSSCRIPVSSKGFRQTPSTVGRG